MHYLPYTAGKMIVHIGIVPCGIQENFLEDRLEALRDTPAPDVIVMHTPKHHKIPTSTCTFWPEHEGLWHDETAENILNLHPRLLILPQISMVALNAEQHTAMLGNLALLMDAGISVETSLSVLEIARVDDLLKPQIGWPMHTTITGDFLRKYVGDYQVHDEQPQAIMARYYRGTIGIPIPLKDNPTNLFNIGNLNRLREIMLRFVNSHFTDSALQTNPAQINIPVSRRMSFEHLAHEMLLAIAGNLTLITLVHALWKYANIPFASVGLLLLAAPTVTALYVSPITSLLTALLAFFSYNVLFVPGNLASNLADPTQTITLLTFLIVTLTVSYFANRQHVTQEREQEEALLLRALLRLAYDLTYAESVEAVLESGLNNIYRTLNHAAVAIKPEGTLWLSQGRNIRLSVGDYDAAKTCMARASIIPPDTNSTWIWCPLHMRRTVLGAVGIRVGNPTKIEGTLSWGTMNLLRAYSDMMVTAMRRLQLREASKNATDEAERESLRAALLSAVSHDLKTPLVSIIGSLSTIRQLGDKLPPEARNELLETAGEEAERLHGIIHNVLELTKLESGAVEPGITEVDMDATFTSLLTRCQRYYPTMDMRIVSPTPQPWVKADPMLLEEVLFNLIDNAAKYAGTDKPLDIAVQENDDGKVHIVIADHGPGIPATEREKVFDKYYRTKQGDSRTAGSGLGLAIARAIIQACDGRIWMESRLDGLPGTVAIVELPRAEEPLNNDNENEED